MNVRPRLSEVSKQALYLLLIFEKVTAVTYSNVLELAGYLASAAHLKPERIPTETMILKIVILRTINLFGDGLSLLLLYPQMNLPRLVKRKMRLLLDLKIKQLVVVSVTLHGFISFL